MPTVQEIHQIWPIARVLASNDISNGALFGKKPNSLLPLQIELIGYAVDYRYGLEDIAGGSIPSESLTNTSNYLYSWCGQYGLAALALINSGGIVPNPVGPTIYGYPISGTYIPSTIGESVLDLGIPSDAIVVWAQKSIQTLAPEDWSWLYPDLTLLNGIQLGELEPLNYSYVLPV